MERNYNFLYETQHVAGFHSGGGLVGLVGSGLNPRALAVLALFTSSGLHSSNEWYLFPFYANDSQVYVPLKKEDVFSSKALLARLDDIEAWMALQFLNFHEKKTEVMRFGPNRSCDPLPC